MHYTLIFLVATLSVAHVILEKPQPFRFVNYGPSNPISPDGSDFPCKLPPGTSLELDGTPTVMAIGEEQNASFSGQAVHGGGSCQFSISGPVTNGSWANYPLKNSEWKVIHSIEGGCPARNQKGNLEGPNEDKYLFKIPEGIELGDYVFSWTWVARIGGEPEYYQNCAPITVISAKTKRTARSDRRGLLTKKMEFPQLFMANMGEVSGGCTTEEALRVQLAIAFPNPGSSIDHPEGTANLFKQQCDGNPGANRGQSGNSAGTTHISTSPSISMPTSVLYSTSSTKVSSAGSLTQSVISSPSTTLGSSHTSDTTIASTSGPGVCIEGHLTCLDDGTHFATCTGGRLTAPQPIAPGFKCRVGSGVGLDISPA